MEETQFRKAGRRGRIAAISVCSRRGRHAQQALGVEGSCGSVAASSPGLLSEGAERRCAVLTGLPPETLKSVAPGGSWLLLWACTSAPRMELGQPF